MGSSTTDPPSLLIKSGSPTTPLVLIVLSGPLLAMGQWNWGLCCLLVGVVFALCAAVQEEIEDEAQAEIRYNILTADDVFYEMKRTKSQFLQISENPQNSSSTSTTKELLTTTHLLLSKGLEALANKYEKEQREAEKEQLSLLCQEAAYLGLTNFEKFDNDSVVTAAISLLALIGKKNCVRRRHLDDPKFGIEIPIGCIQLALERAKLVTSPKEENIHAELQRKACLWLGALADQNSTLAKQIVEKDGHKCILNALQWYRYHEGVVNWGLWALFIVSFEYTEIKANFLDHDVVRICIESLRNCPVLEVQRHGIAMLFDLLREPETGAEGFSSYDVWKVRQSAVALGLHDVVLQAMRDNDGTQTMDIFLMGQELLVGTNYQGDIPAVNPFASQLSIAD